MLSKPVSFLESLPRRFQSTYFSILIPMIYRVLLVTPPNQSSPRLPSLRLPSLFLQRIFLPFLLPLSPPIVSSPSSGRRLMPPRLLCRDLAPPFSAIRPASAVAHVSFFPVPLSASSRRIPVYVYSVTSSVVRVVWVTSCVLSAGQDLSCLAPLYHLFSPSVFDLPCALLSGPLDPLGPIQPLRSVAFQRYTFIPSIVLSVGQDSRKPVPSLAVPFFF
jgi:hypothetical protein